MHSSPRPLPPRASGVLLHLSSLPGPYSVGTLGPEADRFVDALAAAGQSVWQMLPVNPIGSGDSPYATTSSFAGEPLFVDLEALARRGWLEKAELDAAADTNGNAKAKYAKARKIRRHLLPLAFSRARADGWESSDEARDFRAREAEWIDDFGLFQALAQKHGTPVWTEWPSSLARRDQGALDYAREELRDEISFQIFVQARFHADWMALREKAGRAGVRLVGDLPIFVSHASVDVWTSQGSFLLDGAGRPTSVAGCPPDAFNADGQLWGNALYDWDALMRDGFRYWLRRLGRTLELFDAVRLDHFIGFRRYWKIPADARTAREGVWTEAPGDEFFAAMEAAFGKPPLIAEDLGAVTPEVRALRDKFGFPGMKVLQFAFDGSDEARHHLPHLYPENSVAYPGTHDNDTARGWYESLIRRAETEEPVRAELANAEVYLGARPQTVAEAMMRTLMASRAKLVVFPAQDLLGLGTAARMNVPGVGHGNWTWRLKDGQLSGEALERLGALTRLYDRGI